jgi:hypothetical protein
LTAYPGHTPLPTTTPTVWRKYFHARGETSELLGERRLRCAGEFNILHIVC